MNPNRSSAVMQQRTEPLDSLDDFPTPPWATRALMKTVFGVPRVYKSVLDPAAGRGTMLRPLSEYFREVRGFDIHDYGVGVPVQDYFTWTPTAEQRPDWIITNPPFKHGMEFALRALDQANDGVALLLRTAFIEGKKRYEELFRDRPLTHFCPFVERVPMVKGRLDKKASSATSYSWFVWRSRSFAPTTVLHIPPCRKELEKDTDYDFLFDKAN